MTKEKTIEGLTREVEAIADDDEYELMCPICGEVTEYSPREAIKEPEVVAEELYEWGWRYLISREYALEGYLCPECVSTRNDLEDSGK